MDKANLIISMANLTTIRIKKIRKIVNKTNTVIYINQTSPMSTIDPKDTVNLNSMATYKIISMRALKCRDVSSYVISLRPQRYVSRNYGFQ